MTVIALTFFISLIVLVFMVTENPAIVVTLCLVLALIWIFPIPTLIGLIVLGLRSMF